MQNRWSAALTLAALSAVMAVAPFAGAQTAKSGANTRPAKRQQGARLLNRWAQSLNLTGDQKAKLTPILAERARQMRAVRNDASLSDSEKKAKLQSLRQATQPRIDAVLTAGQRKKMAQLRTRQKARAGAGAVRTR